MTGGVGVGRLVGGVGGGGVGGGRPLYTCGCCCGECWNDPTLTVHWDNPGDPERYDAGRETCGAPDPSHGVSSICSHDLGEITCEPCAALAREE